MAKPRVHEIAKEIGISSKDLLTKLGELGEYVRGPSSTLEAPVVRKIREAYNAGGSDNQSKPQAAPKPAPAKPAAPQATPAAPAVTPGAVDPTAAQPARPAAPAPPT